MLEWLLWGTNNVLGITKTKYRDRIIEWLDGEEAMKLNIVERKKYIAKLINDEMAISEQNRRYDRPGSSIASPREALRRAKYFSEDYLNKEFDIFWSLVSDKYLDEFYGKYIDLKQGGKWYTHGNSGIFGCSTKINVMQMDNLSYNPDAKILVANELKLGGKKNQDQILKYSLMYKLLIERQFINQDVKFILMFFSDKIEKMNIGETIEKEIEYCYSSSKSTLKIASSDECIEIAKSTKYVALTWCDLIDFNKKYSGKLDVADQQVERKLIWGFNETLTNKAFMSK